MSGALGKQVLEHYSNNSYATHFKCMLVGFYQGSKGIRQWQVNWCKTQMIVHKITISVDTQINVPTYQNSIKPW